MSLAISPNQLTTPKATGLAALKAPNKKGSAKDGDELRGAFDSFVGETFYGQMIKSMHKMHGKPSYFYGGRAEEAFQSQLDQTMSQEMSKASAHSFTDSMYNLFTLNRNQ